MPSLVFHVSLVIFEVQGNETVPAMCGFHFSRSACCLFEVNLRSATIAPVTYYKSHLAQSFAGLM